MSAKNIVLSEENWRDDLRQLDLTGRTKTLLFTALTAWSRRKNVRGYPQTTPQEFEDLVTYDVESIVMSGKKVARTFVPELRLDGNHRHLVLRRTFFRKQKT